jgi:hypothetical protein
MSGSDRALVRERTVKQRRAFGLLRQVRYRPELAACPHCGAHLVYSHAVWAKTIQNLDGPAHVRNLGFRCANAQCTRPGLIYRSAVGEAQQVKGSGYGLDVVVRSGHLRFRAHQTQEEIWRQLQEESAVQVSECHVQNLIEIYLAHENRQILAQYPGTLKPALGYDTDAGRRKEAVRPRTRSACVSASPLTTVWISNLLRSPRCHPS